MLSVEPHIETLAASAVFAWVSPCQTKKFICTHEGTIEVYQPNQRGQFVPVKTIARAMLLAYTYKINITSIYYCQALDSLSWIYNDNCIVLFEKVSTPEQAIVARELISEVFPLAQHELSADGTFLIAYSPYETHSGILTAHGLHGFVQPKLYIKNLATQQLFILPCVRAFCLVENTLFTLENHPRNVLCIYNELSNTLNKEKFMGDALDGLSFLALAVSPAGDKVAMVVDDFTSKKILLFDRGSLQLRQQYTLGYFSQVNRFYFTSGGHRLVIFTQTTPVRDIFFALPVNLQHTFYGITVFTLIDERQTYGFHTTDEDQFVIGLHINNDNTVMALTAQGLHTWHLSARKDRAERYSYNIVNDRGQQLQVNGIALLKIAHEVVQETLSAVSKNKKGNEELRHIGSGRDWLKLAGRLAKTMAGSEQRVDDKLFPGVLVVGDAGSTQVQIDRNEIVKFPDCRGDYVNITKRLNPLVNRIPPESKLISEWQQALFAGNSEAADEIKQNLYNRHHAFLAKVLLKRLQGKHYPDSYSGDNKKFLDTLLVLMFGVEASRVNATYLTGVMLLDLIANNARFGRLSRLYTWNNAFTSGPGYRWQDDQPRDYGGKFPLAVNSTGRGNFSDRAAMLQGPNEQQALDAILSDPQKHQVPRKEISIILHWLQILTPPEVKLLQTAVNQRIFTKKLKLLFKRRLEKAYNLSATNTQFSKRLEYGIWHQQPKLETQRRQQPMQYYLNVNVLGRPQKPTYYHRCDVPCKLISANYVNGEKRAINRGGRICQSEANIAIAKRDFVGIRKILSQSSLQNSRSPHYEICNGKITLKKQRFGLVQLTRNIPLSPAESKIIREIVLAYTKQNELPYYSPHPHGDSLKKKIYSALKFQAQEDASFTAKITIDQIKGIIRKLREGDEAPPAKRPHRTNDFDEELARRILKTISYAVLPEGRMRETTRYKLKYSRTVIDPEKFSQGQSAVTEYVDGEIMLQLKALCQSKFQRALQSGHLFSNFSQNVVAADSLSDADKRGAVENALYWVMLQMAESVDYQFEKIYQVKDTDLCELQPCPKCYSETAPGHLGTCYNLPRMVCAFHDDTPHYHRLILTPQGQTLCPVLKHDQQAQEFYLEVPGADENKVVKKPVEFAFVAQTEKLGKQACPHCWWPRS